MVWTADSALIREVIYAVSFIERFHCIGKSMQCIVLTLQLKVVSSDGRGVGTISALTEVHVRMAPACVLRDLEELTVN